MIRLGVFTDAHYAEGLTVLGTRTCGKSLEKVRRILAACKDADAVIQLGDLINVSGNAQKDWENICTMQKELGRFVGKVYSVLGNHDVEAAQKRIFLPEQENGYYSFELDGICSLCWMAALLRME